MRMLDYQDATAETADPTIDPWKWKEGDWLQYAALGLCGEAGEVANQIKKIRRDDGDVVTTERTETLAKEIGDALWYVAQVCSALGLSMEYVAEMNLQRLADRKTRGVLHGSGGDR